MASALRLISPLRRSTGFVEAIWGQCFRGMVMEANTSSRAQAQARAFQSVVDLQSAINRFIKDYTAANPKRLTWKAKLDDIDTARSPGFQLLESIR